MTISEKQLAANRRNAQRATGPRSDRGKATAARNAISHGIFARDVVASRAERAEDFDSLRDALIDDLEPQGALEQLLVEDIATLYWRRRRVLRAEAGAIDSSLVEATSGSSSERSREILDRLRMVESLGGSGETYGAPVARGVRDRIATSAEGQAILLGILRAARASLDEEDVFPIPVRRRLLDVLEPGSELVRLIRALETTSPDELPTALLHIRGALERRIARAEDHFSVLDARREEDHNRLTARLALPSGADADRILRYDKTIDNALARALAELGRLQDARRNRVAPEAIPS